MHLPSARIFRFAAHIRLVGDSRHGARQRRGGTGWRCLAHQCRGQICLRCCYARHTSAGSAQAKLVQVGAAHFLGWELILGTLPTEAKSTVRGKFSGTNYNTSLLYCAGRNGFQFEPTNSNPGTPSQSAVLRVAGHSK
eukprot:140616-Rhodomonas_salina.2